LILHLCPKLNFPSKRQFAKEILLGLVGKKSLCIFSYFGKCHFTIASFDLWMSKGACDVFALVINFWGNDW